MIEMKDDARHPQTELNNVPLYCAQWERYAYKDGECVMENGKPKTKIIGSGWRRDQADTAALAMQQNGWIIRGYFGGTI